jgi:hypothetical protein
MYEILYCIYMYVYSLSLSLSLSHTHYVRTGVDRRECTRGAEPTLRSASVMLPIMPLTAMVLLVSNTLATH